MNISQVFVWNFAPKNVWARPPGLFQHVLTVLVFSSRMRLVAGSQSQLALAAHSSDICLDLLPTAPPPPCKNGTHSTSFCKTRGHTLKMLCYFPESFENSSCFCFLELRNSRANSRNMTFFPRDFEDAKSINNSNSSFS